MSTDSFGGWLRELLVTATSVPPSGSVTELDAPVPAASASTKPYGQIWLHLSEEPRFPLRDLRDLYERLCSTTEPQPERITQAFDAIERDVARTFGGMGKFDTQVSRDRLRRVLAAYAMCDPEVGYTQGMNFLAGFTLLHVADERDAFALLHRIMNSPLYHMRTLFLPDLPDIAVTSFVVKHLLWKHVPELAAHFEAVGCEPVFFFEWYFTLYTYILPPDICAEVWEMFLADGWSAVFKVMIALLAHATPHILGKDFHGTVQALKGFQNERVANEYPELHRRCATSSSTAISGSTAGGSGAPTSLASMFPRTWEAIGGPASQFTQFAARVTHTIDALSTTIDAGISSVADRFTRVADRLSDAVAVPPALQSSRHSQSTDEAVASAYTAADAHLTASSTDIQSMEGSLIAATPSAIVEGAAGTAAATTSAASASAASTSGDEPVEVQRGGRVIGQVEVEPMEPVDDAHASVRDLSQRASNSPGRGSDDTCAHPASHSTPGGTGGGYMGGYARVIAALSRGVSEGAPSSSSAAAASGASTAALPVGVQTDEELLSDWVSVPPVPHHDALFVLAPPLDLLARAKALRISRSEVDDLRRRGEAWAQDETVRRDNERMLQAALLVNEDPSESLPPVLMPQ